jgi:5'-nucleotidase
MRILLTNDDGIESPGLTQLAEKLSSDHDVWICAPEGERSACSHSITLRGPIAVRKKRERVFVCDGTPADCVLISLKGLIDKSIDMVISGINAGPNLGTDIIYSGTVAAARQGALMGIPSLASSFCSREKSSSYEIPVQFLSHNAETFYRLWSKDHFLNLNFPGVMNNGMKVAVTFPSIRYYHDVLKKFHAPDGALYCFLDGGDPDSSMERGSDDYAIKAGMISISPISIHPGYEPVIEQYRTTSFWKGSDEV